MTKLAICYHYNYVTRVTTYNMGDCPKDSTGSGTLVGGAAEMVGKQDSRNVRQNPVHEKSAKIHVDND